MENTSRAVHLAASNFHCQLTKQISGECRCFCFEDVMYLSRSSNASIDSEFHRPFSNSWRGRVRTMICFSLHFPSQSSCIHNVKSQLSPWTNVDVGEYKDQRCDLIWPGARFGHTAVYDASKMAFGSMEAIRHTFRIPRTRILAATLALINWVQITSFTKV
eukprot:scaffold20262_cov129-Skeletonema_dohrnii-CCMP3373.AAC.3